MARLNWSTIESQPRMGVDHGVLYLGGKAHSWNGLVFVEEQDNSTIDTSLYYDGKQHRFAMDVGNFSAVVNAFTYPEAFTDYDGFEGFGDNQSRRRFGMSYRVGGPEDYDIHLVYNASVSPTTRQHSTQQGDPRPDLFSWTLVTHGIDMTWTKSASHILVDTRYAHPEPVSLLEDALYGTDFSEPYLPSAPAVIEMFEDYTELRVTYNGDGTFTASGPSYMIENFTESGTAEIDNPNAFSVYDGTYIMRSHWEGG